MKANNMDRDQNIERIVDTSTAIFLILGFICLGFIIGVAL